MGTVASGDSFSYLRMEWERWNLDFKALGILFYTIKQQLGWVGFQGLNSAIKGANVMSFKVSLEYCAVIGMMLLLSACAGTPKTSTWYSPITLKLEQVYNAALIAGTDNGFTVYNQNREAGLISLKKEVIDGDETVVRSMTVKITTFGNKIKVSTKVSGSNSGIVEGALGGTLHKGMTRAFYDCLFKELGITETNFQNVIIVDAP